MLLPTSGLSGFDPYNTTISGKFGYNSTAGKYLGFLFVTHNNGTMAYTIQSEQLGGAWTNTRITSAGSTSLIKRSEFVNVALTNSSLRNSEGIMFANLVYWNRTDVRFLNWRLS